MKLHTRVMAALIGVALVAAMPAYAKTWTLTPYGLGPIKIGMTADQVGKLVGKAISLADDEVSDDPNVCAVVAVPDHPGVSALFEDQKLTSLWLWGASQNKTAEGIGVGASEDAVKAAYPSLEITGADYDEAPAANLTYWVRKDVAGLKFRTDTQRRVTSIAAGGRSIGYMEGCL